MQQLPYAFARSNEIILTESGTACLITRATSLSSLAEAQRVAGTYLTPKKVSSEVFRQALEETYRDSASDAAGAAEQANGHAEGASLTALADDATGVDDLLDQRADAPVVRLINAILIEAIRARASDIHIEVEVDQLVVRFRVDGLLRAALTSNRALAPQLISRIKVMGKLDIAEKRLPQDGRVSLRVAEFHLDARISTIPAQHGERVVMRLLDRSQTRAGIETLGMSPSTRTTFARLLNRPDGLLLVTGPTGSGKTTTLYAGLDALNTRETNTMTIEDPIEYALPGIAQMQVNPATDLTFARGLRAILRQDPNVIMVGEIRDGETARIAVESAMTGHLVLSTLHTNSAIGSIARLIDLGVERFLLAPMLRGVLAQRLVRRICPDCAQQHPLSDAEASLLQNRMQAGETSHAGAGCETCDGTGFKGRIALYHLVEITAGLEQGISNGLPESDLVALAHADGSGLLNDGIAKVREGLTTAQEVARVVFDTTHEAAQ
ncbi:MAG: ATPase, T2SS/T4P/T4SS family [Pseudomonadota bacterium]